MVVMSSLHKPQNTLWVEGGEAPVASSGLISRDLQTCPATCRLHNSQVLLLAVGGWGVKGYLDTSQIMRVNYILVPGRRGTFQMMLLIFSRGRVTPTPAQYLCWLSSASFCP